MSYPTLPDHLQPGLRLVFVGINPGLYSAARGHYFARPTNRFWPAFSRSRVSEPIRTATGRNTLLPEDDAELSRFGIGFTDVVKKPTRNAAELSEADFREGAQELLDRLKTYQPKVACFHGLTGFRAFARYALKEEKKDRSLGLQEQHIGVARLFVVPNPSPANAHFRLDDLVSWYDRLADLLDSG